MSDVSQEDLKLFSELINKYRYDYCKLVHIIFPFGVSGTELETMAPYDWQMQEWSRMSRHFQNPETRDVAFKLCISSGNGAAKTAFGAMTMLMLMYTQRVRGRVTANTKPQLTSIVWPEYDNWFRRARFHDELFEKLGESIKAKDEKLAETWRLDAVTWSENSPASISGLHNKGGCALYIFEEAPGIPAIIWNYASGAMTDTDTMKVWLAFGNSDEPESKFEQNMNSDSWYSKRIDTRTLSHVSKAQIAEWLKECGGNEDHDEFRVRVRGLPRKSAKDSIINNEAVERAVESGLEFDSDSVLMLPCLITCDPAWTGGDETTIWMHQGPFSKLLDRYKLDKAQGQDHMYTYRKLVEYEKRFKADAVYIDQGEGTAIKTLANNQGRYHWELVSFAGSPNDTPEFKDSQYANIRAQMYYEANKWLLEGGVIQAEENEWLDDIKRQLCWTKGGRHKVNLKKLAESKRDIKTRVGQSPDMADGFVLRFARPLTERLPENDVTMPESELGSAALVMPSFAPDYDQEGFDGLYN
jgi:hypothetical protein